MSGPWPSWPRPVPLCHDGLLTHSLGNGRVLFQEIGQLLADNVVHGCTGLTVAQLLLGLAFKLRFFHLDADNCGQTLADILAG